MKVHRIITTIEVENDNSITSVELTKLYPAGDCILLAITNMTTNGNADDITKVYDSVNKSRLDIAGELKGIARIINDSLDDYECGIFGRDYNDSECNDETKADYLDKCHVNFFLIIYIYIRSILYIYIIS